MGVILTANVKHAKGFTLNGVLYSLILNQIILKGLIYFNVFFYYVKKVEIYNISDTFLHSFLIISDLSNNKLVKINFLRHIFF